MGMPPPDTSKKLVPKLRSIMTSTKRDGDGGEGEDDQEGW
jgi:hypothetical protein